MTHEAESAHPSFSEAEVTRWYRTSSFTADWTTQHFPNWAEAFAPYRSRVTRILEIGSWEGRSALFFLNYFPHASLTCIDTWDGGAEHQGNWAVRARESELRFDSNLARFTSRLEKIKALSALALGELGIAGRRFDIVYVDGSHRATDVYVDGSLAWPMVVPGGLLLFDDYGWNIMPDEHARPKLGIDAFLAACAGQYHEILRGYQIIIAKTHLRDQLGAPAARS
jgi:predicted O-methyltransferase YrrM